MISGFKLRHIPSGIQLATPYASMGVAVTFAETHFPAIAHDLKAEPHKLPCDCGLTYEPLALCCGVEMTSWYLDAKLCPSCRRRAAPVYCCPSCGAEDSQ